ncbi:hypothetical protein GQR58_029733 [Nymphon striatum]|nr:hypothetical protein GQR58_029733 [Nymphon striatum]
MSTWNTLSRCAAAGPRTTTRVASLVVAFVEEAAGSHGAANRVKQAAGGSDHADLVFVDPERIDEWNGLRQGAGNVDVALGTSRDDAIETGQPGLGVPRDVAGASLSTEAAVDDANLAFGTSRDIEIVRNHCKVAVALASFVAAVVLGGGYWFGSKVRTDHDQVGHQQVTIQWRDFDQAAVLVAQADLDVDDACGVVVLEHTDPRDLRVSATPFVPVRSASSLISAVDFDAELRTVDDDSLANFEQRTVGFGHAGRDADFGAADPHDRTSHEIATLNVDGRDRTRQVGQEDNLGGRQTNTDLVFEFGKVGFEFVKSFLRADDGFLGIGGVGAVSILRSLQRIEISQSFDRVSDALFGSSRRRRPSARRLANLRSQAAAARSGLRQAPRRAAHEPRRRSSLRRRFLRGEPRAIADRSDARPRSVDEACRRACRSRSPSCSLADSTWSRAALSWLSSPSLSARGSYPTASYMAVMASSVAVPYNRSGVTVRKAEAGERLLELQHIVAFETGTELAEAGQRTFEHEDRATGDFDDDIALVDDRVDHGHTAGHDSGSAITERCIEFEVDGAFELGIATDNDIVAQCDGFHRHSDERWLRGSDRRPSILGRLQLLT